MDIGSGLEFNSLELQRIWEALKSFIPQWKRGLLHSPGETHRESLSVTHTSGQQDLYKEDEFQRHTLLH